MAKRDNAYYEKRLKDKKPAIYGDWIGRLFR